MLDSHYLAGLLWSETFQAALLLVVVAMGMSVLVHVLLPGRRLRLVQQRLIDEGISVEDTRKGCDSPLSRAHISRLVPVEAREFLDALRAVVEAHGLDVRAHSNRLLLHGRPAFHWNVNLIRAVSFSEAEFVVDASAPGACRVVYRAVFDGYWRAVVTMVGALAAAGVLCSIGTVGRATAPAVITLLTGFGLFFLGMRLSAQRTATRTCMDEWILEACAQVRSARREIRGS